MEYEEHGDSIIIIKGPIHIVIFFFSLSRIFMCYINDKRYFEWKTVFEIKMKSNKNPNDFEIRLNSKFKYTYNPIKRIKDDLVTGYWLLLTS